MASDQEAPASSPYFVSLNPSQKSTLLFIHGGFSSHAAWYPVVRQLSQYHILIVDLPGHGSHSSGDIRPVTLSHAASLIADLIRQYANGGWAHIFGFSFGAYTALQLAADHPAVVGRVFATDSGRDWNYSGLTFLGIALFF